MAPNRWSFMISAATTMALNGVLSSCASFDTLRLAVGRLGLAIVGALTLARVRPLTKPVRIARAIRFRVAASSADTATAGGAAPAGGGAGRA